MRSLVIAVLTLCLAGPCFAQQDSIRHSTDSIPAPLSWSRVGITAGALTAGIVALHIYQNNAWWANERTKFHVIEDADYQADFDKLGHTFGGYYSSFFFDQAYHWAGLDSSQSALFGALSGALFEYYVEIEDGFASGWGFSRGDAKSDIAGATFYLLNQRVPILQNFRYKWFYTPTNKLIKDQPDIQGQTVNAIEDYGGQTYYLTADIHGLLPESLKPYWPQWINLALAISGYDINSVDLTSGNPFDLRRKAWYLSLDYDLDKIIPPSSSGFLNFILHALGYWHFPAPAWRFYPSSAFYLTFPVSITIDHGLHIGAEPSLGGTN